MTLPAIITVNGIIGDSSGPQAGRIVWHRNTSLLPASSLDLHYQIPEEIVTVVDVDGIVEQPVYSTNDPACSPTGWTWTVTTHFPHWKQTFAVAVPYDAAGGEINFNELTPVPPNEDGALYALASHTHSAYEAEIAALETFQASAERSRVAAAGEYVIDRGEVTAESPVSAFNLYVTHFVAAITETIMTIRTGVGTGVATGAQHAWIGILRWDGSFYHPVAASVDDPTRWAAGFTSYDTPIFDWDHPGESGHEGFDKVEGTEYAMWVLWIGSGNAPNLFAGGGNYQDSLEPPRTNAYIGSQTQPPAAPINGSFFGPDSRRFQALLKR